jgi:Glutathione synthase/Ribosomal protein S6 modification enzyme (glutaminyl transferase)
VLAERLNEMGETARRVRSIDQLDRLWDSDHHKIVMWGAHIPVGYEGLNNLPLSDKLSDALKLKEAGVATVEASRTRPITPMVAEVGDPITYHVPARSGERDLLIAALEAEIAHLHCQQAYEVRMVPAATSWIGRSRFHVGGNDLLNPPASPDYWVRKETLTEEYRVHVFDQRSIRAGTKIPRAGVSPHSWVRSWDGGWMISYQGVTEPVRSLAKAAVAALGLDFGAVDIGRKEDGSLIVLEVNRAPGLEGGTIDAYANAIVRKIGEAPIAAQEG